MFNAVANKYWPGTEWNGNSDMHVSVCFNGTIPLSATSQQKQILHLLESKNVGSYIFRHLSKRFSKLTWILTPEEFTAVFLVDCYRHMNGESDSRSPKKIKNPNTGNVFHRVAVVDDIVCGIRFWCDPCGDETILGWRFRITKMDEAEEETRRRTRELSVEAVEQMDELHEFIFDVKEPSESVALQVEKVLCSLEIEDGETEAQKDWEGY